MWYSVEGGPKTVAVWCGTVFKVVLIQRQFGAVQCFSVAETASIWCGTVFKVFLKQRQFGVVQCLKCS